MVVGLFTNHKNYRSSCLVGPLRIDIELGDGQFRLDGWSEDGHPSDNNLDPTYGYFIRNEVVVEPSIKFPTGYLNPHLYMLDVSTVLF